jgi:hypothetical protein
MMMTRTGAPYYITEIGLKRKKEVNAGSFYNGIPNRAIPRRNAKVSVSIPINSRFIVSDSSSFAPWKGDMR